MKISAPNYTQTPNVFFDEIVRTLNEGELRVMLIIMRQTFGWHKLEDWITLKFLAEKTGYDRRSVCRILERLIEKNLISKRVEGDPGHEKCYYSLVTEEVKREELKKDDGVETEEEKAIFKKSNTDDRRVTPPVTSQSPPPVTDGSPTKERIYTKETTTKEKTASPNVVVFSCLKNLGLEQKALYTLMQFPEERVELAVKFLQSLKKPPNNPAGLLIWHCQQVMPPPCGESKEEIIKKNKAWAKKREEEWLKNRTGCRIDALKDCCQIVIGGQKGTIDYSYSNADMIEKLKEELRKRE